MCRPLNQRTTSMQKYLSNPFINSMQGDVVSFTAKKYDADSIVNPTNHCAYCGCKVYTESQIDALAKSMLGNKSHRLQGDIKSILEKLESAVRSEELSFVKKLENSEEIKFFKKFQSIAEDKSFLKGDAIFEQVYGMDSDTALETLKANMRPLLKTIDHVSPQNLEEDNNNSDVNLVEACYCCNHDIKKGFSFSEFYAMFPSIKENMPPDKFHYAYSKLISSSASGVLNRMSATNLLKYVQRLFGQREETVTRLGSIDFRIKEVVASIDSNIQTCHDEIAEKESQIAELEAKLDGMADDKEYNALVSRLQKVQQKDTLETLLQSLRERRKNISDALNELRNPPKKQKKPLKNEMTPEEKEAKIQTYKAQIEELNQDIKQKESQIDDIDIEIMDLDTEFPTIEILQGWKSKADTLCSQHSQLARERENVEQLQQKLADFDAKITTCNDEIAQYPESAFDASKYTKEEQEQYNRYTSLLEASKYIEGHMSGTSVKAVINQYAKMGVENELASLSQTDIVMAANDALRRKELQSQLDSLTKQRADVANQINASNKQITVLSRLTAEKTLTEAQDESAQLADHIRILNEKQNYLKIPSTILALNAEIVLLQTTIKDLEAKQAEITAIPDIKF